MFEYQILGSSIFMFHSTHLVLVVIILIPFLWNQSTVGMTKHQGHPMIYNLTTQNTHADAMER